MDTYWLVNKGHSVIGIQFTSIEKAYTLLKGIHSVRWRLFCIFESLLAGEGEGFSFIDFYSLKEIQTGAGNVWEKEIIGEQHFFQCTYSYPLGIEKELRGSEE